MNFRIFRMTLVLALAGSANSQPLAAGKLLLATAKSHDPDFTRSLVLLIHYDSESAIGLMLNKPTTVPISEILPEANGKSVTVYAGGPVSIGVRGLLRSKSPPFFSVVSNRLQILEADLRWRAAQFFPDLRWLHRLDHPAVTKRSRARTLESHARKSWNPLAAFGAASKALT